MDFITKDVQDKKAAINVKSIDRLPSLQNDDRLTQNKKQDYTFNKVLIDAYKKLWIIG